MMRTEDDNFVNKSVAVIMIPAEEIGFLCGDVTLNEWGATLDFLKQQLGFEGREMKIQLEKDSHLMVRLENYVRRRMMSI